MRSTLLFFFSFALLASCSAPELDPPSKEVVDWVNDCLPVPSECDGDILYIDNDIYKVVTEGGLTTLDGTSKSLIRNVRDGELGLLLLGLQNANQVGRIKRVVSNREDPEAYKQAESEWRQRTSRNRRQNDDTGEVRLAGISNDTDSWRLRGRFL